MLRAVVPSKSPFWIGRFVRMFSAAAATGAQLVDAGSAATSSVKISKELLVKMRKESGYSYVKCRTALNKFGEQNYAQALGWLNETAKKEGWEKAAKLASRDTSQGLFGLLTSSAEGVGLPAGEIGGVGAVVELRCETDFVGRSAEFKQLVSELTTTLLKSAKHMVNSNSLSKLGDQKILAIEIDPNQVKTSDNRSPVEAVAATIGKLGENITISKFCLYFTAPGTSLFGHVHPLERKDDIKMGRILSLVGLQRGQSPPTHFPTETLGNQICQHVIGMVPTVLGTPLSAEDFAQKSEQLMKEREEEEQNAAASSAELTESEKQDEELNAFTKSEGPQIDENETALLRQSFLLNPSESVSGYLEGHGAQVTDFVRLEHGKN